MLKTNVIRILAQHKIAYEELAYEVKEFKSGLDTVNALNLDPNLVFKTIVCKNQNKYFVLVIPVLKEIDLKKAAKNIGQKSLELIPTKELLSLTGYERGGCSPIGMKKLWPTFIANEALNLTHFYISAGKIGYQVKVNPNDIAKLINAKFIDLD